MKRTLPVLLALSLLGCAHTVSRPQSTMFQPRPEPAPALATPAPAEPVTVSHDGWSLTFPAGWSIDETPEVQGDPADHVVQVLEATSDQAYGRGPIRFALITQPLDASLPTGKAGQVVFAQVLADITPKMFPMSQVSKQKMVVMDGRPTSLTLLKLPKGVGIIVAGTAQAPTGYILVCGGDAAQAKEELGDKCGDIFQSFSVK